MKLSIKEINASDESDIMTVSVLANTILHEFYGANMPAAHIDFFLDSFQSRQAIQKQLLGNWEYFIIEFHDVAIGYIGLQYQSDRMILSKLYVLSNQRNSGAGRLAMEFIHERANKSEVKSIELIVNVENARAIKFYEKWKFVNIEKQHNTYDNGHIEVDFLMRKNLEN